MSKVVIKSLVLRVYLLRALDAIGSLFVLASFFLSYKAAIVCFGGFVLWIMANRVRPTRFERGGIWSKEFMKLARIHTKRTKTASPR